MNFAYFFGSIANTHLLNTSLMYVLGEIFGYEVFLMRLPNLLSYLLYLYFTYKIVKTDKNIILQISFFLILNTNHFVLEFFALARGYGMSMAFLLGSLYYFFLFLKNEKSHKILYWSFLYLNLALLASYILFYVYFIFIFLILFFLLHKHKNIWLIFKKYKVLIATQIIFGSFIFLMLIRLKMNGMLYVGGAQNLWESTIKSLIMSSLYEESYSFIYPYMNIILAVFFLLFTILYIQNILYKSFFQSYFSIIYTLILAVLFLTYLQFLFLNTPFLEARTAVFLIPLLLLLFCFFFQEVLAKVKLMKFRFLGSSFVVGISIILCFHLWQVKNFNWLYYGNESLETTKMLKDLKKRLKKDQKVNLGVSYELTGTVNFYRMSQNIDFLHPVGYNILFEEGKDNFYNQVIETGKYDFYYFRENDKKKILDNTKITILSKYPKTNTYLAKVH